MQTEKIGFSWSIDQDDLDLSPVGKDVARFRLKKLMPEFVWDIIHLEDNPYDFSEVQTLLDGITVGGHTLFEQKQVLNQYKSLLHLFELVKKDKFTFEAETILAAHNMIAEEEAFEWGCLRKGEVRISGTDHRPPGANDLKTLFQNGIETIRHIQHPVERALVYFFYGSLNQFFYDGNKRTSRWTMNGVLMSNGYNYLTVPGAKKDEFNRKMVGFYNNKDASEVIKFMTECYVVD